MSVVCQTSLSERQQSAWIPLSFHLLCLKKEPLFCFRAKGLSAWSVPWSQLAIWGHSPCYSAFKTCCAFCLAIPSSLGAGNCYCSLVHPFLTKPPSVSSRYWFCQLRSCPIPNPIGRPSILVPQNLVSSSFLEVTALRTGEELLMRGLKTRLGDLLRWGQGTHKPMWNPAKTGMLGAAVVLSGKSTIPVKLVQRKYCVISNTKLSWYLAEPVQNTNSPSRERKINLELLALHWGIVVAVPCLFWACLAAAGSCGCTSQIPEPPPSA